jgi:Family of unknown function (DUF5681)
VLIGHAPHRTKKGQNGLEAQPALSRLEALEEGSVGQSGRQAEGLMQQGAPPLGLGSVGQVDAFQAGVGCGATEGDADIPRDHNAVGRAVGIDMAERAWKRNPRYRGLRPWKKGQSGNPKGRPPGSRNKVSGELALGRLVQIMESKRASAIARVKAAKIILDLAMLGLDE